MHAPFFLWDSIHLEATVYHNLKDILGKTLECHIADIFKGENFRQNHYILYEYFADFYFRQYGKGRRIHYVIIVQKENFAG